MYFSLVYSTSRALHTLVWTRVSILHHIPPASRTSLAFLVEYICWQQSLRFSCLNSCRFLRVDGFGLAFPFPSLCFASAQRETVFGPFACKLRLLLQKGRRRVRGAGGGPGPFQAPLRWVFPLPRPAPRRDSFSGFRPVSSVSA